MIWKAEDFLQILRNKEPCKNKFDAELNVINLLFSKTIPICYISMPLNAKLLIGCMTKISLCNQKKLTKSPLYFFLLHNYNWRASWCLRTEN